MQQHDNVNLNEDEKFGGYVDVEVWRNGKYGPVLMQKERSHNLVTTIGKKKIWQVLSGNSTNIFDQFRVGSSSLAATGSQTNLIAVITGTTQTVDTKTISAGRTFQWMMSYAIGTLSAPAVKEVALCNQNTAPGGSVAMRCVFTTVVMTLADKLKITYSARVT